MTRPSARLALASALILAGLGARPVGAQVEPARQVTLFGIVATPGAPATDPKLAKISPQLRKLLPGYGFKLRGVESRRLAPGQSLTCDLGPGYAAEVRLDSASNADGKVALRVSFEQSGQVLATMDVTAPPNQLFFCDKRLPDSSRLVVGIGAR